MNGLRVLITNSALTHRSGTETYVRDLALALLRHGHSPTFYSTLLGETADELTAAGIPALDDLAALPQPPDVIHGQHHPETMTALLHFPGVPALYFCHARLDWQDEAPLFPRIRRYVAVDDLCAERFACTPGLEPFRVRVLLHGVDQGRYRPRLPLPQRPQRALVFSHQASEETHLPAVRQTCNKLGVVLDVAGAGAGHCCAGPERLLPDYDLVFAKARCAQEALAVGCAVVLCDAVGAGELVTTGNWERLRRWNFGRRVLSCAVTPEHLIAQARNYDAADADETARQFRAAADMDGYVRDLVGLYREVIEEQHRVGPGDGLAELRAAAVYLRHISPKKRMDEWHLRAVRADGRAAQAESRAGHLDDELTRVRSELLRSRLVRLFRRAVAWPWRLVRRAG